MEDYRARVECGIVIQVEAFDWNCPQHITARYTEAQVDDLIAPLVEENRSLKAARGDARIDLPKVLGSGPLELIVSGIRQLTPRVRGYELRHPEGLALPEVGAGSHLQVPVRLPGGKTAVRQYSISSDPARRELYEIAVLREESGTGGSLAVHEAFEIGTRLRCGLPLNHFPLHGEQRPAVLIAGGIGITPIKAMAHALKVRGSFMQLHYASRSASEAAFREELLREFGGVSTIYSSADGERMDIGKVLSAAPEDALFYVCGPERLVDAALKAAASLHIDSNRVRVERFTA